MLNVFAFVLSVCTFIQHHDIYEWLLQVLKKEGIDYIVAPYEADAQMTFLCMKKHVDAVITEDSDLIPFGCSKVCVLSFFTYMKMIWIPDCFNLYTLLTLWFSINYFYFLLSCHVLVIFSTWDANYWYFCFQIIFKMDKFGQGVLFQSSMLGQNEELDFSGFTKQMFLEMCILSGCDYLQSVPGMGLKRAHALIQKFKSYEKVIGT